MCKLCRLVHVARAAGSELNSVAAKDKAATYARELIGEGLKEELGDAAAVSNTTTTTSS